MNIENKCSCHKIDDETIFEWQKKVYGTPVHSMYDSQEKVIC